MIKIAIIGDQKVGKLSFNKCFSTNTFSTNSDYNMDFYNSEQQIGDKKLNLQVWHYSNDTRRYIQQTFFYRKTLGVMVCYGVDSRQSFENIQKYIEEVKQYITQSFEIMLIGTKCDVDKERQVSYNEGQTLANSLGIQFFEVSSQQNINVKEPFIKLAENILQNRQLQKDVFDQDLHSLSSKSQTYKSQCY